VWRRVKDDVFDPLWRIRLVDGPVPVILAVLAVVALALLVLLSPRRRRLPVLSAGLITAATGSLLVWLLWDVLRVFAASPGLWTRIWIAISLCGIGMLAGRVRHRGTPRRVTAIVLGASVFLVAGAVGANIETGQFPAVGWLVGKTVFPDLALPARIMATTGNTPSNWTQPPGLPRRGQVGRIPIPGLVSHFAVRDAIVYLPPAALVSHPPRLPVVVMLSGQPGIPSNMVTSVDMPAILDRFASAHRGLAPIVVIPDQLGSPHENPMCVDSPLGNSATYLSVDVPNWIRTHLNVLGDRDHWAIGGYSQGGTCSIQLGSRFPELFGSILDISGEIAPHRGSREATIASGFRGSADAYDAAKPLSLIAKGAPYTDTLAIFAVGATDAKYERYADTLDNAAQQAGMRTMKLVAPQTGHDWLTVHYAIEHGVSVLCRNWNLE